MLYTVIYRLQKTQSVCITWTILEVTLHCGHGTKFQAVEWDINYLSGLHSPKYPSLSISLACCFSPTINPSWIFRNCFLSAPDVWLKSHSLHNYLPPSAIVCLAYACIHLHLPVSMQHAPLITPRLFAAICVPLGYAWPIQLHGLCAWDVVVILI